MTDSPDPKAPSDQRSEITPPVPEAVPAQAPAFDRRMLEALVCPEAQGTLTYDAEAQELISKAAGLAYPIRNGIPIMLVDEARRLDP